MPEGKSAAGARSGTRGYRSELRSEQARETRRRILAAASKVFADKGYSGTSLSDIAGEAGVSVESVKVHGPKGQLLLSAFEVAFGGAEGQTSLADGPELQSLVAIENVEAFLTGLVGFIADANARTSGLWAAFLSAASIDAPVRARLDELLGRRRADYRGMVKLLQERGAVTASAGRAELHALADTLSFVMSPEGHQQLVTQSGWSQSRYRTWLVAAVRRELAAAG